MKKLVSIVLALALVLLCVGAAMADTVNITVNRDSSYGEGSGDRTYTWYRVFTATPADVGSTNTAENPGTITTTVSNAAYTATSAVANKLGTWDSETKTWTRKASTGEGDTGNQWFNLTPIAGTTNYSVAWYGDATAARAQAAAEWLIANEVYEATGSLEPNATGTAWTAAVPAGYYLIKGSAGANLVAATTSITINEKNTYPGIDKKQKQENDASYTEAVIPAEVNSYVYYEVAVTVPADANKAIAVIDTVTTGLVYDSATGLTVVNNDASPATVSYTAMTSESGDTEYSDASNVAWQIKFSDATVVANQGKTIYIRYRAQVTADALTVDTRKNTATLKYDQGHYTVTDDIDHKLYLAGIEKRDGTTTTTKLEGVKFNVTVGGNAFNVTKVTPSGEGAQPYYIPGGTSNEVITGANGLVIFRGLRNDVTYVLTETETNAGYNLLPTPVSITPTIEDKTANPYATQTYTPVDNNKGTVLPSTGGIGTTIFYILGGLLVVGAAVILVARRKAQD